MKQGAPTQRREQYRNDFRRFLSDLSAGCACPDRQLAVCLLPPTRHRLALPGHVRRVPPCGEVIVRHVTKRQWFLPACDGFAIYAALPLWMLIVVVVFAESPVASIMKWKSQWLVAQSLVEAMLLLTQDQPLAAYGPSILVTR